MNPLFCQDTTEADELLCHGAITAPKVAGDAFMFMPAGLQEITPSQGGKSVRVRVLVDASAAQALESQRATLTARGKKPYFDFNHEDGPASFWPTEFFWRPDGVYARGLWSRTGRESVEGREWRQFSPVFHVDNVRGNPARIVAREDAKPNMGGLVNDPAFHTILPFWAKNADGAQSIENNQENKKMTPEQIAALQAKNTELQNEINGLKAKESTAKTKNENTALIESELKAKEAELKLGQSTIENEGLKAKSAALEAAAKVRAEADADKAIADAIARGAIAAKDEDAKKSWKALIVTDSANAALLAKIAGHPALTSGRVTNGQVVVTGEDPKGVFSRLGALLARNQEARDVRVKGEISRDISAIYATEFRGDNSGRMLDLPLQAADLTDGNLGTIAGSLVSQRVLELLRFQFPVLSRVATDFSTENATFGQTIISRTVTIPGVSAYNTTTGWSAATAATTDVPVTINNHKGVTIEFNNQLLASTARRLFAELAPAAAYALAKDVVDALYALITTTAFASTATTVVSASVARSTVIELAKQLTLRGVPIMDRTLLLHPNPYAALVGDATLVTLASFQRPQIIEGNGSGVNFPIPVENFNVYQAPNLPANNGNITGFAFDKSALLLASRLPNDYTAVLPGAAHGNVTAITDADTGLSVLQVQYVDHKLARASQRIELMYGVAAGQPNAGQILRAVTGAGSTQ